jgi:hypothetical protein
VRVGATGVAYYVGGDGVRHWIPNGGTYDCLYLWDGVSAYENLSQGQVDSFPTGGNQTCVVTQAYDTIVRVGATGKAYYVDPGDGLRHSIQDGATYNCLVKRGKFVYYDLTQAQVDTIPLGAAYPKISC